MTRRKRCTGAHADKFHRDGSRTCEVCGDHYPCKRADCGHVDCADERDRIARPRAARQPKKAEPTPLEAAVLAHVEVK